MAKTIVLVDGLDLLEPAMAAAKHARPDNLFEYSVRGLGSCQDLQLPDGRALHVHYFGDDASIMGGRHMQQHLDASGDYVYVTRAPTAPYVTQFCAGMAALDTKAKPEILTV